MKCPFCESPVSVTDKAGNPWFSCGSTKSFRSSSCLDREPLATELRNAKDRIQSLIEERDRANRLAEWKWNLRDEFESLLGTDNIEKGIKAVKEMKQRIKRLEEAGDRLAGTTPPSSDRYMAWIKAKEAKP